MGDHCTPECPTCNRPNKQTTCKGPRQYAKATCPAKVQAAKSVSWNRARAPAPLAGVGTRNGRALNGEEESAARIITSIRRRSRARRTRSWNSRPPRKQSRSPCPSTQGSSGTCASNAGRSLRPPCCSSLSTRIDSKRSDKWARQRTETRTPVGLHRRVGDVARAQKGIKLRHLG